MRFILAFALGLFTLISPEVRLRAQTWTLDNDGAWNVNTNWTPSGFPNATGASATLGSAITANRIITLGQAIKVGSLSISDDNNYSISGRNTFTFDASGAGPATLTIGGSGSPIFTSAITLTDSLTVDQSSSGTLTSFGRISGSGGLTKNGTGRMILYGQNTFTGGVTLNSGILQITAERALGTTNSSLVFNGGTLNIASSIVASEGKVFTMTGAGTLDIDSGQTLTLGTDGQLSGSGALTKSGLGTLLISGNNAATYTGTTIIQSGILSISAENNLGAAGNDVTLNGGTLNVTGGFTADGGKVFTFSSGGGTLDIEGGQTLTLGTAGQLSGSGALTKSGLGTLTLGGNNSATFTGTTTIEEGTLRVTAENNLGAAGNDVTFNGGTLNVGGSFTANSGKVFTVNSGGGAFDVDSSITLTLGTASQLTGSGAMTKLGSGILSITAAQSTYTGSVTVNEGTLSVNGAGRLAGATAFTLAAGGTLKLDNSAVNGTDRISNTAGLTFTGGTLRFDGRTTGSSSETGGAVTLSSGANKISINNPTTSFASVLTLASLSRTLGSTVTFENAGSGTIGTSGNNPRIVFTSAPTLVNSLIGGWATVDDLTWATYGANGVARLTTYETSTNPNQWGSTENVRPSGNASLNNNKTINSLNLTNGITISMGSRDLVLRTGGLLNSGGANTISGTSGVLTAGTGAAGNQDLIVTTATGTTLNISALIGNNSSTVVGLTKSGGGALTLSNGGNTYGGATFINAGTLTLGAAGAIPDGSAVSVSEGATFDLNDLSETIGSLAGAGTVTLGTGTLTLGGDNSSTEFSGVISGTGGLTKTGAGTLTLSGASTYTGNTTINAGTVSISAESNLGAGTSDIIFGGGTLSVTEGFTANTGKVLNFTGDGTVNVAANETLTFTDASQLTGVGDLTKTGAGTLTLGGATLYTGNFVVDAGEIKVAGTQANVDALLSASRINALTGTGGTVTFAYSNENLTNAITSQPTSPSSIKLGFDLAGNTTNTWYVLGLSNDSLTNWDGLMIRDGNIQMGGDQSFAGDGNTTFEMSGGYLQLAGGAVVVGGKTLTVTGDATLSGGYIDGGPGGGSVGKMVIGGNLISKGTVLLSSPDITMNPLAGTVTVSGTTPLNGIGTFTKTGGGTVELQQAISANTIIINQGTLLLGGDNRINDTANMSLGPGTFATGGYSETLGLLTLTANSTLDLGSGDTSFLNFGNSSSQPWSGTLLIVNYLDSSEKIYFGTTSGGLTQGQLDSINWQDPFGPGSGLVLGSIIDFDGRIRPRPVPEPATIFTVLLLSAGLLYRERKRCGQFLRQWLAKT
jgi:fibronectin-binding autotransporter adhesin